MAGKAKNPFANFVFLQGRLTRDPEIRYLPTGTALITFSMANTRYYKKDGERKEKTGFFDCKAWGKLAEYLGDKLKKGDDVQVQGELEFEQWEDRNNGSKRSKVTIMASSVAQLSWPDDDGGSHGSRNYDDRSSSGGGRGTGYPATGAPAQDDDYPITEDDIPF